jgi:hypothetical protein
VRSSLQKNLKNSWRAACQDGRSLTRPSGKQTNRPQRTITIGGIALSAARSKLQRHEDAIRIVHVIAERFAMGEATVSIELASRLKGSH